MSTQIFAMCIFVFLYVAMFAPLGVPEVTKFGVRRRDAESNRPSSWDTQGRVEKEQFQELAELWADGRDHWIPAEWIVRDGYERESWG